MLRAGHHALFAFGGGLLTGKYRQGATGRLTRSTPEGYEENTGTKAILDELALIAAEVDATPGQVALAWTLTKNCFPIIGARTLAHITESINALLIRLSPDQLARLDVVSAVPMGYPHDLLKTVQKVY